MSENNELAAAVERLATHAKRKATDTVAALRTSPYYVARKGMDYSALQADERLVSDAVLPEFDATLVDEAWLEKLGLDFFSRGKQGPQVVVRNFHTKSEELNLLVLERWGEEWRLFVRSLLLYKNPTRGQLLTLCRALGIQLKEQA